MNASPKTDNYTLYGIHSKTDRSLLAGYCSFLFTSSLIGDILVLIGSSERYHAIKLHKILVVFVQNIAIADIVVSVFRVIPCAVSLIADRWVFGNVFCHVSFFGSLSAVGSHFGLISGFAFAKLLIVKFPLRALAWPKKGAYITTGIIWTVWTVITLLVDIFGRSGVYFSYYSYSCEKMWSPSLVATSWIEAYHVALGITLLTSTLVTIVSSIILLAVAKRAVGAGQLQWRGVATVLVTVGVYILSVLPLALYFLISTFVSRGNLAQLQFYLYRFASFFGLVSMISNFYIYIATFPSFRVLLKNLAKKMYSCVSLRLTVAQQDSASSQTKK